MHRALGVGLAIVAPKLVPAIDGEGTLDGRTRRRVRAAVQSLVGRPVVGVLVVLDEE
jgi:hypothetical protein